MSERFWFRPSQVAEGVVVLARCQRCLHSTALDLAALSASGDAPLRQTEARLRCNGPARNGDGACGGRARLDIIAPSDGGPDGFWYSRPILKDA